MKKRDRQKGPLRKLGYYGTVPIWFQRTDRGTFVLFNDLRIANRSGGGSSWLSIAAGWKITPIGGFEIRVQRNNSDGVIVPLQWLVK
jgi:hypothetical protein